MFGHIGLEVTDREKARIFFEEILGIPRVRSFTISPCIGISKLEFSSDFRL